MALRKSATSEAHAAAVSAAAPRIPAAEVAVPEAAAAEAVVQMAVETAPAVAEVSVPAAVPAAVPAEILPKAADILAATQEKVTKQMENNMKTAEEFVSFGQGNVEAFVKAGQIWAAGVQDITKQFAATAQAQMDQTVATFKAMAGVKSVKEAVELQTTLARSSVEKAMAETGKLTDASMKLTEQAFAPITARVTLAMEKFGRTAA